MAGTKRYYECHITLAEPPGSVVRDFVEQWAWTFSAIDGDPDLGSGVKCYATRQFNERLGLDGAITAVSAMGAELRQRGFAVTREKVEHVVYDRRVEPTP